MRSSTRATPFASCFRGYLNDPHGLVTLRKYKEQFERDAVLADMHNAYYRVRSNFAVMYAAVALAIDYEILPWKKRSTFRAIEKCMRLALAELHTGRTQGASNGTNHRCASPWQSPEKATHPSETGVGQAKTKGDE